MGLSNRCQSADCTKHRMYGFQGMKAKYCSQHKEPGMIDVHNRRCEHKNCQKHPTYGFKDKKARYCTTHKVDGMVDVHCKPCKYEGCTKHPHYGFEGEKAQFCATHKIPGMVDVKHKRCHVTRCKGIRVYESVGKKSRFCQVHLEEKQLTKKRKLEAVEQQRCSGSGAAATAATAKYPASAVPATATAAAAAFASGASAKRSASESPAARREAQQMQQQQQQQEAHRPLSLPYHQQHVQLPQGAELGKVPSHPHSMGLMAPEVGTLPMPRIAHKLFTEAKPQVVTKKRLSSSSSGDADAPADGPRQVSPHLAPSIAPVAPYTPARDGDHASKPKRSSPIFSALNRGTHNTSNTSPRARPLSAVIEGKASQIKQGPDGKNQTLQASIMKLLHHGGSGITPGGIIRSSSDLGDMRGDEVPGHAYNRSLGVVPYSPFSSFNSGISGRGSIGSAHGSITSVGSDRMSGHWLAHGSFSSGEGNRASYLSDGGIRGSLDGRVSGMSLNHGDKRPSGSYQAHPATSGVGVGVDYRGSLSHPHQHLQQQQQQHQPQSQSHPLRVSQTEADHMMLAAQYNAAHQAQHLHQHQRSGHPQAGVFHVNYSGAGGMQQPAQRGYPYHGHHSGHPGPAAVPGQFIVHQRQAQPPSLSVHTSGTGLPQQSSTPVITPPSQTQVQAQESTPADRASEPEASKLATSAAVVDSAPVPTPEGSGEAKGVEPNKPEWPVASKAMQSLAAAAAAAAADQTTGKKGGSDPSTSTKTGQSSSTCMV